MVSKIETSHNQQEHADDGNSAPSQTCATSTITVAASTSFITFACFDVSTGSVEEYASIAMSMPMRFPHLAPTSSYDTEQAAWTTVTQVLGTDGNYPFHTTATSSQPEDPLLATDTSLYTSAEPITALTTMAQHSVSGFSTSTSTSTAQSTWPTGAQATPSSTSLESTPRAKASNHTTMIFGVVSGSLTALAIIWVSLDYLRLRIKHHRRHSISDCSDGGILAHQDDEKQTPYGYYGTNRAGTIPKDASAREVNAEPVELSAEVVAADRV